MFINSNNATLVSTTNHRMGQMVGKKGTLLANGELGQFDFTTATATMRSVATKVSVMHNSCIVDTKNSSYTFALS